MKVNKLLASPITILLLLIILIAAVIRIWDLTNYPAGLNADEAAIGYNAYSLLLTGKDEYGTPFPLIFKSFGDYKPGLYFYFVIPFVALLGLTELAVRLPSALMGVATVYIVYLLGKDIFKNAWVGLASASLLAITPWHIHFSRGGWETNAATFFMALGSYLLLRGFFNIHYLFLALLSFLASLYTYQSPRLVVPLFLLLATIFYRNLWIKQLSWNLLRNKRLLVYCAALAILSIPLLLQFASGQGVSRFSGLSFLSDPGPALHTNELRGEHLSLTGISARILHNKFTAYLPNYLGHYLDHFSPNFLFINGDPLIRNKVPESGQFYLLLSILLIAGIIFLIQKSNDHTKLIIAWVLVAPTASAMTYQTPHALRSLNMVIPLIIVSGYGLSMLLSFIKKKMRILAVLLVIIILTFEATHYLESYFRHYPKRYPVAWQYGFKEMVGKLEKYEGNYQRVVVTDRYDQPYILLLFFKRYDPLRYQPQAYLTERDKFNFGTIRGFDKYEFRRIDGDEIYREKGVLFIGTEEEFPLKLRELLPKTITAFDEVYFPNGKLAFIIIGT